jgi:hypothetical protein
MRSTTWAKIARSQGRNRDTRFVLVTADAIAAVMAGRLVIEEVTTKAIRAARPDLQAECAAWWDAMPEGLRDTPTGEALRAIVELDLDAITSVEPPRGFGRD